MESLSLQPSIIPSEANQKKKAAAVTLECLSPSHPSAPTFEWDCPLRNFYNPSRKPFRPCTLLLPLSFSLFASHLLPQHHSLNTQKKKKNVEKKTEKRKEKNILKFEKIHPWHISRT